MSQFISGNDRLLRPDDAAQLIGVTTGTLANWRTSGDGPPSLKIGKRAVRYRLSDLNQWLADRNPEAAERIEEGEAA